MCFGCLRIRDGTGLPQPARGRSFAGKTETRRDVDSGHHHQRCGAQRSSWGAHPHVGAPDSGPLPRGYDQCSGGMTARSGIVNSDSGTVVTVPRSVLGWNPQALGLTRGGGRRAEGHINLTFLPPEFHV